jgi:hypothetical protein
MGVPGFTGWRSISAKHSSQNTWFSSISFPQRMQLMASPPFPAYCTLFFAVRKEEKFKYNRIFLTFYVPY